MATGRQVRQPEQQAQTEGQRLSSHPVIGFIPWILFWVIGGPSTWETASIAALVAALLVAGLSLDVQPRVAWGVPARRGAARPRWRLVLSHLKLLDLATIVFFAALTVAAVVTSRQDVDQLDKYAQAISSGALALIAVGSILARHPFTIDYAKQETPPQVWHTPLFQRINVVLSGAWAVVFAITAGLGLWAAMTSVGGLRDWLNWYIPIVLIFLAFRFTKWYPEQAKAAAHLEAPDA